MDIPVPDAVTEEVSHDTGSGASGLRASTEVSSVDMASFRKAQEDRSAEELKYLQQAGVTKTLNALLSKVLADRPECPLSTIANDLRRDVVVPSDDVPDKDPRAVLREETGDRAEYVQKHKMQVVVDEMIRQLVEEKPSDVQAYCLSWLRWNCKHILWAQDA